MNSLSPLDDFQVIELRRYTIRDGQRENFARYFESWFPETFQQLGAIAFGEGLERDNATWFTWLRGFRDMDARATVNANFYYGPVWKEHRSTLNGLMTDSDNVLLLQPLNPDRALRVLPAVDVVEERNGAQGIVVMQLFPFREGAVEAFAKQAEEIFSRYRSAGVREAGVLVTLDAPNNFPQLPVRTDGPWLAWIGIVEDDAKLEAQFRPLVQDALPSLEAGGLLRGEPELVIMDPAPRSRLRWLP